MSIKHHERYLVDRREQTVDYCTRYIHCFI